MLPIYHVAMVATAQSVLTSTVSLSETYRDFSSKEKQTHSFVHKQKTNASVYGSLPTLMMPIAHKEPGMVTDYGGGATVNFTKFLMVRELVDLIHPMPKHMSADFEGRLLAFKASLSISCHPSTFKNNNTFGNGNTAYRLKKCANDRQNNQH